MEPEKRYGHKSLAMLNYFSFPYVKQTSETFMREAMNPSTLYLNIPKNGVTMKKAMSPNNLSFLYNIKIEDDRYGKNDMRQNLKILHLKTLHRTDIKKAHSTKEIVIKQCWSYFRVSEMESQVKDQIRFTVNGKLHIVGPEVGVETRLVRFL